MHFSGRIHQFPKNVRAFLVFFLLSLSIGYFVGFAFVDKTTDLDTEGIERNFNGNEDEEAEEYFFKKPEGELLTIIHTHVLSLSLIFLALGGLLLFTSIHPILKGILLIEPFISLWLTFGGIWLLWKDVVWFKHVIMVSGIAMNLSFVAMVLILLWHLLFPRPQGE